MKNYNIKHKKFHTGATLLDVLIAILVLAVGMLGIAAGQLVSLKNNMSSLQRSQATVQSYSILDAMRANVTAARQGSYDRALPEEGCDIPEASSLITSDLNNWLSSIQETLGPDSCGGIDCNGSVCDITIRWNDERGSGGTAGQLLSTRSEL